MYCKMVIKSDYRFDRQSNSKTIDTRRPAATEHREKEVGASYIQIFGDSSQSALMRRLSLVCILNLDYGKV